MNSNPNDNSTNTDPVSKTEHCITDKAHAAEPPVPIAGELLNPSAQLLLSLQKMEEDNAHLEELAEDGRKKLAEAIATNNRFLKIVAHDLRNPFSTTIGILDLLIKNIDEWDQAEIKQCIIEASHSANKALILVENLLTWSMVQNIKKAFNPVKINLHDLVVSEIDRLSTAAFLKKITLDLSIDSGLHVTADFEMVKTIFRNLISNAIKYTLVHGHIHLTACEEKRAVKVEVIDDGVGMTQRTKEKLFKIDEFFSVPGTNNEQGTGLGLLFCKEFIELHGGKIWIESEPGKGSTFKFTLPHYL